MSSSMATIQADAEKAFVPYSDDESLPPQTTTKLPYWARIREKRSRWFSWKTVFFVFIIIGLIVARAVEGPIRAKWHKQHAHHASKPQSTKLKGEEAASPVADATGPAVSFPAEADTAMPADLNDPLESDMSSTATIGVSIAASVDGEGNRQIYDLTSEGVLRVRKIQSGLYKYTTPEIIGVTEKPQKASPLSAISWRGPDQSIETHLIYLNNNNRIVRIAANQTNATAPSTSWKTLNVLSSNVAAYGGFAIVNIGPRYFPNLNAAQLRIIFVDQAGDIRHLNTLGQDQFVHGQTGFKAAPGSDISLGVKRDATGQVTDISIIYVDAKGGLKEILTDEKNARNTYKAGRTVDPLFPTTFAGHFATVFGGPPPINRVFTLNPNAPGERNAAPGKDYSQSWWQTANDKWYYPQKTGGALAAVAWGDKEVRIIFKSKASDRKLVEVGLSDQGPGAGIKWFGRGFFN